MLLASSTQVSQRPGQRSLQRPRTATITRRYEDGSEEAVALEGYSRREVREEYDHFFSIARRE
jgi:hypothetical protein